MSKEFLKKINWWNVFLVPCLLLILFSIKYFNSIKINEVSHYYNFKIEMEINGEYIDINSKFGRCIDEFYLWGLPGDAYEKKKLYSKNNIFVLHFCDLTHPNKYAIWNYSDKKLRFGAPWFEIGLKKGLNIIGISTGNEAKITYEDQSSIDIETSFEDYSKNWFTDFINYKKFYDPAFERQRSIEFETRGRLLSLYFYVCIIVMLLLLNKGYQIRLGFLFYFLMLYFFGELFTNYGVLCGLYSHPSGFFLRNFYSLYLLAILIFCIKMIFDGFKNITLMKFRDICFVIFLILIPIMLYY